MFENKFKQFTIILIIFGILLFSKNIFAFCNVTSNLDGIEINKLSETDDEVVFSLFYNDVIRIPDHINIIPTSDCYSNNREVIFKLYSNLHFSMQTDKYDWVLNIDANVFDFNGNNFIIDVYCWDNLLSNKTFSFTITTPKVINSTGYSFIKMIEHYERPHWGNIYSSKGPYGISLNLKEVIVKDGASLDINLVASSGKDFGTNETQGSGRGFVYDSLRSDLNYNINFDDALSYLEDIRINSWSDNGDGIHGGNVFFVSDSLVIEDNGNLNLNLKSGNGGKGNRGADKKSKRGGFGGSGGDVLVDINKIENRSNFNLEVFAGSGGNGGNGSKEGGLGVGSPKEGGSGGFGGFVFLDINSIFDYGSNLNFNLLAGSGGSGGNGGRNRGLSDSSSGGHAGHGGSVYLNNIDTFIINSNFNFFINAGNGGNGGKRGDDAGGSRGNGGYGGFISNLFINRLENNSSNAQTNLEFISGRYGVKGSKGSNGIDGLSGSTGDIKINYLINKTENLNINTILNQTLDEGIDNVDFSHLLKSGDIHINYLDSGSYLPRSLKTINNNVIDNSVIDITSCYISSSTEKSLQYSAGLFSLRSVNGAQILNSFDYDHSKIDLFFNDNTIDCPYCDILDMDSDYRINHNFAIYSDVPGIIKANDLNIYYATESQPDIPFSLPLENNNEPYVVYSNRSEINASTSNIDSAIYMYDLSKNNLYVPNSLGDGLINEDDKLYCPAQQYYLKAKITNQDGSDIEVEFPFVPLYSLD